MPVWDAEWDGHNIKVEYLVIGGFLGVGSTVRRCLYFDGKCICKKEDFAVPIPILGMIAACNWSEWEDNLIGYIKDKNGHIQHIVDCAFYIRGANEYSGWFFLFTLWFRRLRAALWIDSELIPIRNEHGELEYEI